MIKFFHNIVPKNNELSTLEIFRFFVKNLPLLIIITLITSYLFYFFIKTIPMIEAKYNMVASGYLVSGKHSYEAKLELINSEISEILKFGKLSTDPKSIIVLTNLQQLIDYSRNLLSSQDRTKRLVDSKLRNSILMKSNLRDNITSIDSHSIYFEMIFQDFEETNVDKEFNNEDLIKITTDFINKHITIVIGEMRQRYLNSIEVIRQLLIEEGVRLEYMIEKMEMLLKNNDTRNKYNDFTNTYNQYLLEYNLSLIQIPFFLNKVSEIENTINRVITRDLITLHENKIYLNQDILKLSSYRINLFSKFSSIQLTFFFSIFVFLMMFLMLIFINSLINQNKN